MSTTKGISHADLVELAYRIGQHEGCYGWRDPMQRWARGERPDYLGVWFVPHEPGWLGWNKMGERVRAGDTLMLECKRDVADFKRDADKKWRDRGTSALGRYRAFVVTEGLVEQHDVPDESGWGLYEMVEGGSFRMLKAPMRQPDAAVDELGTIALLARLCRVAEGGKGAAPSNGSARGRFSDRKWETIRAVLGSNEMTAAQIKREAPDTLRGITAKALSEVLFSYGPSNSVGCVDPYAMPRVFRLSCDGQYAIGND